MNRIAATIALISLMLTGGAVSAASLDECKSDVYLSCSRMRINICPAGDFEFIRNSCDPPGMQYIVIIARDRFNNPIRGIPRTDYWLNACDPSKQLCLCAEPIVADSSTGANGRTTLSGRIAGGGCTIQQGQLTGQGICVSIQGKTIVAKPCPSPYPLCLAIDVKSPDITGPGGQPNGVIDLSDLATLSSCYNTAWGVPPPPGRQFNACWDFNDDNAVNLTDFSFFREHYKHYCH